MAPWNWPSRDSVQAPCMKSRQIYTVIIFLGSMKTKKKALHLAIG